jgi:hypothetical protein
VNITFVVLQMGEPEYWESLPKPILEAPITPELSSPRNPRDVGMILEITGLGGQM